MCGLASLRSPDDPLLLEAYHTLTTTTTAGTTSTTTSAIVSDSAAISTITSGSSSSNTGGNGNGASIGTAASPEETLAAHLTQLLPLRDRNTLAPTLQQLTQVTRRSNQLPHNSCCALLTTTFYLINPPLLVDV